MMRLLDLFCGAGGASAGYAGAGFEVYGVDLNPMPHYPYPFRQAGALEVLGQLIDGWTLPFRLSGSASTEPGERIELALHDFDAIHASPPCQAYSVTRHSHGIQYPELIEPVRQSLIETGLPYIIENVVGAPLNDPTMLCGTEFGLTAYDPATELRVQLQRHRLFESNVTLARYGTCDHSRYPIAGVYGGGSSTRSTDRKDWPAGRPGRGGYTPHAAVRRELMGIDWMNRDELSEAIPPVFTTYLGGILRAAVR